MQSMIPKISKLQWFVLALILVLPFLLNILAIQQQIGTRGLFRLVLGVYHPIDPNLPVASSGDIFTKLFFSTLLLGLLPLLAILLSNVRFFRQQRLLIRLIGASVVALPIAKVFEIASGFFMPLFWLPEFIDSLGLPGSTFAFRGSQVLVFPATTILLLFAMAFPKPQKTEREKKNLADLETWKNFVSTHPGIHILQTAEWGELKAEFGRCELSRAMPGCRFSSASYRWGLRLLISQSRFGQTVDGGRWTTDHKPSSMVYGQKSTKSAAKNAPSFSRWNQMLGKVNLHPSSFILHPSQAPTTSNLPAPSSFRSKAVKTISWPA